MLLKKLNPGIMSDNRAEHKEGEGAKKIEEQTAKISSEVFLWAALVSMGVSAVLKLTDHKHTALFVGQWAAPFLLLGVYNKIVKTQGSVQETSLRRH